MKGLEVMLQSLFASMGLDPAKIMQGASELQATATKAATALEALQEAADLILLQQAAILALIETQSPLPAHLCDTTNGILEVFAKTESEIYGD